MPGLRGRKKRAAWFAVAAAASILAHPGGADVTAAHPRPLMRDFVGLNSYAPGHSPHRGFDPELYRPVTRLLREYHNVRRDLGDEPAVPAPLPLGKDGTDWPAIYREWTRHGWDIDACLQFELVARDAWNDIETEARRYGRDFARAFGPSGAGGYVKTVEIGNEPTKWSDEDYTRMFRALAQGLREGDPKLRIATSNITVRPSGEWDKSVSCIAAYPELYDVLALHIYPEVEVGPTWRRSYPENPKLLRYLNDVEALCRWRDRHAPDKAVWITEFGYDSSTKTADPGGEYPHWVGVTDVQQAQWLVRSLLMFASMPVERAYIYFFNDRDRPSLHASAGITRNFEPKPSFHALAHVQAVLGDFRFRRIVAAEEGSVRIHEFERDDAGQRVWAVWSPTGSELSSRRVLPRLPGRLVRVERMPLSADADQVAVDVVKQRDDGTVEVELTESPLYLIIDMDGATASGASMSASSSSDMADSMFTAQDLQNWLRSLHPVPEPSVDHVIVGDPATPVRGIGVAWTPTWDALREAHARGCNVFVTHEPTFFTHLELQDVSATNPDLSEAALRVMGETRDAKRRWIEERGMVVIRCHDVLDQMPGGIVDALAEKLGFKSEDVVEMLPYYQIVRVDPPMPAAELGQRLADAFGTLGQPGVAFYGDPERVVHRLGLGTGYASDLWKFVEMGAEMCVTIDDRIKTWTETEWADDSGFPMIVIHHGTSEEPGVRRLHKLLAEKFPNVPVELIRQGFRARWIAPK